MRKALITAVAAAAMAIPPALVAAPPAHANPACQGITIQGFTEACERLEATCQQAASLPDGGAAYQNCEQGLQQAVQQARQEEQQQRQRQQTSKVTPSPTQAPATTPVQAPTNSPTMPARSPATKPAAVAPPKGLDASPQAIAAAKAAPATKVDPANPPTAPTQKDFTQQVQGVVNAHNNNVDMVSVDNQVLARPRHWDYIDYDVGSRPIFYNPISEAMTFRYFYSGAYRAVYVPAGGRVVLDAATVGVYPFTAVSDSYLTSGSFYGGGTPPAVYRDVSAYIPAADQTVQVGKVTAVGHDDSQPAGSQDTFMLNDSTLAWGQANNPSDGGQITVAKTQSLPGVGPTDNGGVLVALAAHQQPTRTWWPWLLGAGVLVIAVGLIAWVGTRRKGERTRGSASGGRYGA